MIDIKNVTMKFDMGIEKGFSFKQLFINLFDPMRNISPKYFLEIITAYLHKQNRKA